MLTQDRDMDKPESALDSFCVFPDGLFDVDDKIDAAETRFPQEYPYCMPRSERHTCDGQLTHPTIDSAPTLKKYYCHTQVKKSPSRCAISSKH